MKLFLVSSLNDEFISSILHLLALNYPILSVWICFRIRNTGTDPQHCFWITRQTVFMTNPIILPCSRPPRTSAARLRSGGCGPPCQRITARMEWGWGAPARNRIARRSRNVGSPRTRRRPRHPTSRGRTESRWEIFYIETENTPFPPPLS